MKLFQILLISLLVLIFGALFGIYSSLNSEFYNSDDYIILNQNELEELGVYTTDNEEEILSFSTQSFTFEQFIKAYQIEGNTTSSIKNKFEPLGYVLEEEEENYYYLQYYNCRYDDVYDHDTCLEANIEIDDDEVFIETILIKEGEDE